MEKTSSPEKKQYQQKAIFEPTALDQLLMKMPTPPSDLPRPWNYQRWQRYLSVLFFLILFGTWFIGKGLDISFLEIRTFEGSLLIAFGVVLFLGLYLLNRSQTLGYIRNYSARANKPLQRAIKRYRRPLADENLLQIFPRYRVGKEDYYLVWYVPGSGTVWATSLKQGSEPLLFDENGQWLDNQELFSKVALMWMYALDFAPRSLRQKKHRNAKKYQQEIQRILSPFWGTLKNNQKTLIDQGFEEEIELIHIGYSAMLALYRNSLDTTLKIIQWADALGWDSMTVLNYDVILDLHEKIQQKNKIEKEFKEQHLIKKVNLSAEKMVLFLREVDNSHRNYFQLSMMIDGLETLTESFDPSPEEFKYIDGLWLPPQWVIKAYQSRVDFARQVDQGVN